jgi:hypothetical protein
MSISQKKLIANRPLRLLRQPKQNSKTVNIIKPAETPENKESFKSEQTNPDQSGQNSPPIAALPFAGSDGQQGSTDVSTQKWAHTPVCPYNLHRFVSDSNGGYDEERT